MAAVLQEAGRGVLEGGLGDVERAVPHGVVVALLVDDVFDLFLDGVDVLGLTAVADVSQESADRLGKEYGVNAYSDYRAMFGQEKPDIVSITTWQNVRAEITVAAADRGSRRRRAERARARPSTDVPVAPP